MWPVSRALYPKQLLPLVGDHTLIQQTALRVSDPKLFARPLIVANDAHRFVIAEQLRELEIEPLAILLEPEGRNTAPAIALAALRLLANEPNNEPNPVMLVMPSDHVIKDEPAFREAVARASVAADQGRLATFGIQPDRPETGYGYIQAGQALADAPGAFDVDAFTEKPDAKRAESYLEAGGYYWNSGMFLFGAQTFLDELGAHHPDIVEACEAAIKVCQSDLDFERPDAGAFRKSPSISIDYAVMEKTGKAAVVPVNMGWSDVGSWAALKDIGTKNADGNVVLGDVILEDVTNSLVRSEGPLVSVLGLDNVVVVATKDAVLVSSLDRSQEVRKIVDRLKKEGRSEPDIHIRVFRPWGSYEGTDAGDRFQTKRLIVKPGAKLSLQAHHHRAEHWVVVRGSARVTCDDKVFILNENESTYIPIGAKHRLENPGKIPLHIIEVQSGTYLGEDDIIRFEDTYGRLDENE